ncbi:hypothetical protein B0H67DRAFT_572739 [Lasiosphaeris hirsuta]|uniref:Uncharacterized protein n=1 Tax=Lasiosphaeris hirsuta TaxID=260670 RepID=A0AA40DZZ0_9PEZI|nr:hypothetical protein B0H67DRAFT_572739 [Lasiosphaeris hirsuta]
MASAKAARPPTSPTSATFDIHQPSWFRELHLQPRRISQPKYEGFPPRGMDSGVNLELWNRFIGMEPQASDAPLDGGYLLVCRRKVANKLKEFQARMLKEKNLDFRDWESTYSYRDPDSVMMNIFRDENGKLCPQHIWGRCLSWGQTVRAMERSSDIHILMKAGAPIFSTDSYWSAVEAGMVTDPRSRVQRVIRYDVGEGPISTEGVVIWEKSKHKPLGTRFEDQDWSRDPNANYPDANPIFVAEPL